MNLYAFLCELFLFRNADKLSESDSGTHAKAVERFSFLISANSNYFRFVSLRGGKQHLTAEKKKKKTLIKLNSIFKNS